MADGAPAEEHGPTEAEMTEAMYSPNYLDGAGPAMLGGPTVPADKGPSSGGLLGRWAGLKTVQSSKRMLDCAASQPQYRDWDFLKPQHFPRETATRELNYNPAPDVRETRFHRGFHRRPMAAIQSDAPRLEREQQLEERREMIAQQAVEVARDMKEKVTFNVLTGEGVGREEEFKKVGKRIINPTGTMEQIFMEHEADDITRQRSSKHRYFQHPAPEKLERTRNLVEEGLVHTKRESMIIGYGDGAPRLKRESVGVPDNFAHMRGRARPVIWEETVDKNRSQIQLG